jgi:predicted ATP-binding protein involved in virulence
MLIRKLTLTNFRAYTHSEFEFKPNLNLLVGVNGVGKTSVLEALKVCLSIIYPYITDSKSRKEGFTTNDVRIGAENLQVSCDFTHLGTNFNLLIVKQKESYRVNESDNIREQTTSTPDQEILTPGITITRQGRSELSEAPIGIYFSTKRSLVTEKSLASASPRSGSAAAYVEALSENRAFNLKLFADWFKVLETLEEERSSLSLYIAAMRTALATFLPEFGNLHVVDIDGSRHLFMDKHGLPLSIHQFSDGERGVLSIVLDIAKRLAQANPGLDNPLQQGDGVILIDELDLHLHPQWQRTIVNNLTRTFPNCQFIATTHSPQIIGEVKPDCITIIGEEIYKPGSSYGIDSSRVLEELQGTPARTGRVADQLSQLYKSIDDGKLTEAKKQIRGLAAILGENDPEIIRSATMINFLQDQISNETDNKK